MTRPLAIRRPLTPMDTQSLSTDENKMDAIFELRGRKIGYRCTRWGGELHAVERGWFPCSSTGYRSLSGAKDTPSIALLEALAMNQDCENASLLKRCRQATRNTNVHGRDFILARSAAEAALGNGFFAAPDLRAQLWPVAYQLFNHIIAAPEIHPAHPTQGLNRTVWTPDHCETAIRHVIAHRDWLAGLLNGTFALPGWTDQRVPHEATAYFRRPPAGPEPVIGVPALEMSLGLDIPAADKAEHDDEATDDDDGEDAEHEPEADAEPTNTDGKHVTTHRQDDQLSLF